MCPLLFLAYFYFTLVSCTFATNYLDVFNFFYGFFASKSEKTNQSWSLVPTLKCHAYSQFLWGEQPILVNCEQALRCDFVSALYKRDCVI